MVLWWCADGDYDCDSDDANDDDDVGDNIMWVSRVPVGASSVVGALLLVLVCAGPAVRVRDGSPAVAPLPPRVDLQGQAGERLWRA